MVAEDEKDAAKQAKDAGEGKTTEGTKAVKETAKTELKTDTRGSEDTRNTEEQKTAQEVSMKESRQRNDGKWYFRGHAGWIRIYPL